MGITLKNNKSVTKNMTIKGDDGVGIKAITSGTPVVTEEKTTTPITVTLTDETTQNFNVEAKNGSGANNALTKPTTAPSATQIVAVDNTNSQKMLAIGDGLSIENDTLKASGGSGKKLYNHQLIALNLIYLNIITSSNEIFTKSSLANYLYTNGYIDATKYLELNYKSYQFANGKLEIYDGFFSTDGMVVAKNKWVIDLENKTCNLDYASSFATAITDAVTEL